MKVHATLKNLRIAPRKVRLVTHSLVGLYAREALVQLDKQVKRSSRPITDLLKSALANARNNNGLDEENLYILEIRVGDGLRLKRWLPRAFGRATPLLRRGSNVTIVLEEKIEGKNRIVKKKEKIEQGAPAASPTLEKTEKEKEVQKTAVKPEIKKDVVRGVKSTGGTVVKKMFQRKSI